MTYTAEQLIQRYVQLRDDKAALAARHAEEMKPFNEGLTIIENALADILHAQGGENIKTGAGTAYFSDVVSFKVEDWPAFYTYVYQGQHADMLVRNANKTAVKDFMDANNGALPPGLSMNTVRNLNVRRA